MSLSRNDQVEPKTIENGVIVPPGLQYGEMTLADHQDYLVWMKMQRPLTREEAIAAGHRPKEVYKYFGPLDAKLEGKPTLELKAEPKAEAAERPGLAPIMAKVAPLLQDFAQKAIEVYKDEKFAESRAQGYTGDSCPGCGNFTMVNNGTCLVCVGCGHTTGCS